MRTTVLALAVIVAAGALQACEEEDGLLDATAPSSNGGSDGAVSAVDAALPSPGASPTSTGDAGPVSHDAGAAPQLDAAQAANTPPPADGGATSDGGSTAPAAVNYGAKGRFTDAKMFESTGPDGIYVLFRPDTSLGQGGFKHPIGVWGNGLGTTPDQYQDLLTLVASHGFVVIGCPDVIAEEPCLTLGIDWLAQQNSGSGPLAGKLDTSREFSMGFSWGGGAAIDVAKRPNIKATISMHGMPPRSDPWGSMHAPLLFFTGLGDSIVPADSFVAENYTNSKVQTFLGTMQDSSLEHMYVLDANSLSCSLGAQDLLGPCTGGLEEQTPAVAWLSYWLLEDQGGRSYFFGDDCKLCSGKWKAQRKNWN